MGGGSSFFLLYERSVPCIHVISVSGCLCNADDGGDHEPAERNDHIRSGDKHGGNNAENQMGDTGACSANIKMMQADDAEHKGKENSNGFLPERRKLIGRDQTASAIRAK